MAKKTQREIEGRTEEGFKKHRENAKREIKVKRRMLRIIKESWPTVYFKALSKAEKMVDEE